jgi:hypothetical protein
MLYRRLCPALLLLVAVSDIATAQRRRPRGENPRDTATGGNAPVWFASAGAGMQWGAYIVDDRSQSIWDFDAGFSLRGGIEREVAPRFTLGLAFNYARLPLNLRSTAQATTGCRSCAADATISSYGASMRYGGGLGFHQVIEGFVGAMRYGNFTPAAGGQGLAVTPNTDFAFGGGYGFAYGIAPDWQVQLIQDGLYAIHERSTLGLGGGRIVRHFNSRLAVRVGF